jgi:hypothetical protein
MVLISLSTPPLSDAEAIKAAPLVKLDSSHLADPAARTHVLFKTRIVNTFLELYTNVNASIIIILEQKCWNLRSESQSNLLDMIVTQVHLEM